MAHFDAIGALDRDEGEAFWSALLAGWNGAAWLADHQPAEALETTRTLDPATATAVRRLAARLGVEVDVVVHAAVGFVLAHAAGGSDVVLGAIHSNLDGPVGAIEAPVPLRVALRDDDVVTDWITRLGRRAQAARRWAPLAPAGVGHASSYAPPRRVRSTRCVRSTPASR